MKFKKVALSLLFSSALGSCFYFWEQPKVAAAQAVATLDADGRHHGIMQGLGETSYRSSDVPLPQEAPPVDLPQLRLVQALGITGGVFSFILLSHRPSKALKACIPAPLMIREQNPLCPVEARTRALVSQIPHPSTNDSSATGPSAAGDTAGNPAHGANRRWIIGGGIGTGLGLFTGAVIVRSRDNAKEHSSPATQRSL